MAQRNTKGTAVPSTTAHHHAGEHVKEMVGHIAAHLGRRQARVGATQRTLKYPGKLVRAGFAEQSATFRMKI
jgi:hypothetical protein